jgi:DNA-binding GntR family transcriptional regulator
MTEPQRLGPLETSSLRTKAHAAIRASIITGELQAGEIFPVSYFASRLGVSATPVREALFDLGREGLVEVVRNRGFRVPVLTDAELDDIFEVRMLLEVPSIGRLGDLDLDTIAECREYARHNEAYARAGDVAGFLESDRLFHGRLLRPLGNRRLTELIAQLRDIARLPGLSQLAGSPELSISAREHEALIDALVRSDRERAVAMMRRHLEHSRGLWAGRANAERPFARLDGQGA